MLTRLEQKAVARDFTAALSTVSRNVERCLNTVEHDSTPGTDGPQAESVEYRATIESNDCSSADPGPSGHEIVVQMGWPNLVGDYSEGGINILVADLDKAGAASKLTSLPRAKSDLLTRPVIR
jgi:hypothetical protein